MIGFWEFTRMKPNIASTSYSLAVGSHNNHSVLLYTLTISPITLQKQKREKLSFLSSVPYDILFSNEFLKDLSRLWSLRDIVPDPNNLPWIEKDDK